MKVDLTDVERAADAIRESLRGRWPISASEEVDASFRAARAALLATAERVLAMEEALRPFADAAESYDAPGYPDTAGIQAWALTGVASVGDLRRARQALPQEDTQP